VSRFSSPLAEDRIENFLRAFFSNADRHVRRLKKVIDKEDRLRQEFAEP